VAQAQSVGAQVDRVIAAVNYTGRQIVLKSVAAVTGIMGAVTKSPVLTAVSTATSATAIVDTKVTTGELDRNEVAVTVMGATPGVAGLAARVAQIHELAEVIKAGQEGIHVGAATLSAEAALIETKMGGSTEHGEGGQGEAGQKKPAANQKDPASQFNFHDKSSCAGPLGGFECDRQLTVPGGFTN